MADLTVANSGYQTGEIDTARTLVAGQDMKRAQHHNGPNSAIVQLETTLGLGPDLRGTLTDLVSRLAVALNTNGTLKLNGVGTSTVGTGFLDGNVLIGDSSTGGLKQGSLLAGHGLDQTVGNGTIRLDTHLSLVVFDANGTFTVPPGVTQIVVRIWGASGGNGGGGAGGNGNAGESTSGGNGGGGGKGAAGSYGEEIFPVVAGTPYTVTIGAGGLAGTAAGAGQTGQTTSFGGLMSVAGSSGGAAGGNGTAGGVSPTNGTAGATGANGVTYGTVTGARIVIRGGGKPEALALSTGGAGGDITGSAGVGAGSVGTQGQSGLVAVAY